MSVRGWRQEAGRTIALGTILAAVFNLLVTSPTWAQVQAQQGAQVIQIVDGMQVEDGRVYNGITLPDNRELRRQFEAVRRQLETDSQAEAVRRLGTLLADPTIEDFFLVDSLQQRSRPSFRAELRRMIAELPPQSQAIYQLEFAPVAEKRFQSALESGNVDELKRVAQSFPSTPAGEQAWFLLGSLYMNNRQPAAAAACWARLAESRGAAAFQPRLSLLAAAAAHSAGLSDSAHEFLQRLTENQASANLTLAGEPLAKLPEAKLPEADVEAWLQEQFGPARGTMARQSVPDLNLSGLAAWRAELTGEADVLETLRQHRESEWRDKQAALPVLRPRVVHDDILISTRTGLRVYSAKTGKFRWGWPNDAEADGFQRNVWEDLAYGQVDSDGQSAFLVVDNAELPELNNRSHRHVAFFGGWNGEMPEFPGNANRLLALDLKRQGSLRWSVGGEQGEDEEAAPALADHVFLGNPLYYGGQLFVIAEANHAIRLLVLSAATGKVEWTQELAAVEHAIGADTFRQMAGARPVLSGSTIICPTGAGCLVAVDEATRSLSWAYCYPRDESARPGVRSRQTSESQNAGVTSLLTSGEYLLAAPIDSNEIHCVRIDNGNLVWKAPSKEIVYAALDQHQAILVGPNNAQAITLADGKPAWPQPCAFPARALPSGVGIQGGDHYYLPLSNASILQIRTSSGEVVGQIRPEMQLPLGNLVWTGRQIVSLGPGFLEAFQNLPNATDVAAQGSDDPQALKAAAEVHLAAGQLDEAISDIQQAYKIAPDSQLRSLLIRLLLKGQRASPNNPQYAQQLRPFLQPARKFGP